MPTSQPLLPQHATPAEAIITSVQWLFEPYWTGDRLMARLQDGRVTLTDKAGEPAGTAFADAADELLSAIDAEAAVVDGIWSAQPFVVDGGVGRQWAKAPTAERPADGLPDPLSIEKRRAFVAVDLVELDGQSLRDVPYQERRRLLESVVQENVRVRVTPAVRQPVRPWLNVWRGNGFTRYVAKHVNSRYRSGEQADDWLVISAAPEEIPAFGIRVAGRRRKKPRRIED